jgi:hypothetical protein
MATVDKNFRVKNGLNVAGNATFESNVILGTTPISFDATSNRLQIFINNEWKPIAFTADIASADAITFMDLALSIDYNGEPTYMLQANGVLTSGTKFADGGTPSSTSWSYDFDSGALA